VGSGAVDADRWQAARNAARATTTVRIKISFLDMIILLDREPVVF
jgi:hypothetical protein